MSRESFENLIKEYHPMIYKICRVYSTETDFDDLYQEVLISIWKSQKSFKGHSKLSTWLYRVTLNTALTFQRNTKKYKTRISIDQVAEIPDQANVDAEKEQQIHRLYDAISQLKLNDRSIILLYLDEKSYEEIAEITGLSVSNIGVKINRLKKRILKFLNPDKNG